MNNTKNAEEVYEIAILGRITWNLHSLNNEGTVGNVTEPRTIMLADGRKTDGVSGEMLKHIHMEKMWELQDDKNNFCEACKQLKPERADNNEDVRSKKEPEEAVSAAIKCVLCDIHGFLVQKPTVSRSSLVEFGWAVGIPEVHRDIHTHARHSVHEQFVAIEEEKEINKWGNEKCSEKGCTTQPEDSKLYKIKNKWYCEEHSPVKTSQMVYHRPTRSGTYAIITLFQPWRICLNNVTCKYENENNRKNRYELVLKAYQSMFLNPQGAMCTTRLPHTENFEGIIVYTTANYPVPLISPLRDDYIQQIEGICSITGINEKIKTAKFSNLGEFVNIIQQLIECNPYIMKKCDNLTTQNSSPRNPTKRESSQPTTPPQNNKTTLN